MICLALFVSFSRRDSGIQHTNSLSISDADDGGQLFDIVVQLQAQQAAHEAQQAAHEVQQAAHEAQQAAAHEALQAQIHAQQAANQEQQNVLQAQWAANQVQLAELREVQAAHRAQLLGINAVNQDTHRRYDILLRKVRGFQCNYLQELTVLY